MRSRTDPPLLPPPPRTSPLGAEGDLGNCCCCLLLSCCSGCCALEADAKGDEAGFGGMGGFAGGEGFVVPTVTSFRLSPLPLPLPLFPFAIVAALDIVSSRLRRALESWPCRPTAPPPSPLLLLLLLLPLFPLCTEAVAELEGGGGFTGLLADLLAGKGGRDAPCGAGGFGGFGGGAAGR